MAEQKIEDSKSPVARRAVRPFVGPATPGNAAPAARPLVRPAGPAGRPNPAPFAPPLASPAGASPARRATLGSVPVADDAQTAAVPDLRPTTPAPTFDLTVAAPTPIVSAAVETPEPLADLGEATDVGSELLPMPPAMAPASDADASPSVDAAPRRPVTSEMVAIDAYAAFDSVWGSNTPQASPAVEGAAPAASPAEDVSLGACVDGPHAWTDEIMVPTDDATAAARDANDTSGGHVESVDSTWTRVATPDSAIPAWLLDDPSSVNTPPVNTPPAHTLAADTPSAPDQSETFAAEAVSLRTAHGLRISAVLDRLAERVRDGEIDVSSVAPEAPDAAVLASVLAALLGGSNSR